MRVRLVVAVCLSIFLAPASTAAAANPAPDTTRPDLGERSAKGYFAPYPRDDFTIMAESGTITAGSCQYRQAIDNPHISSTSPRATSVHGYWKQVGGTCPSKANVDTYLQAYWCDQFGCRWITVDSSSGDVYAGGGSGRRVTAREECSSSGKLVGWRGFVDVDLIGQSDPSGYTYSSAVNLYCVP